MGDRKRNLHIYCDFDGTITRRDSIVALTEGLGGGKEFRRAIIREVKNGSMTNYEAIQREMASVRASWEKARDFLVAQVAMDGEFPPFVRWCQDQGYPVAVVSSGIEQVVGHFIGDLGIPYFAHPVEMNPAGWIYRKREEHDKVHILKAAPAGSKIVFVGDGTSDISVLPWVDLLFAKSYLAEYCRNRGTSFIPFETFRDVREELSRYCNAL